MARKKIIPNPTLSSNIKARRKLLKITQADLATKIGVEDQTIRKYESGKHGIPMHALKCIANELHCCVEYLQGITDYITAEEYAAEQNAVAELVEFAAKQQSASHKQWQITEDLLSVFLNYKIIHTYVMDKTGSFEPCVKIVDHCNSEYVFSSRKDAEDFLLSFYGNVAQLLRYRLLDYAAQKEAHSKP